MPAPLFIMFFSLLGYALVAWLSDSADETVLIEDYNSDNNAKEIINV